MSHQSDWGYYKQLIKLTLVKVNHVGEHFIRTAIFVLLQIEPGIIVLALFYHCRCCNTMVNPVLFR